MAKDFFEKSLEYHRVNKGFGSGKIEVIPKVSVRDKNELSLAYTPGVAFPCLEIARDSEKIYEYTIKGNTVFVISNGSAVLGLGNIGHKASLPVMEGKALLFKIFAGIDAYPIIISSRDEDEAIRTIINIADGAGGINLEDISAPSCFYIEEKLSECLDIPVFHDDQHGTAVVTLAGLINALKLSQKDIEKVKIVINGSGAAGIAVARLLIEYGARYLIICDREGAIYRGREINMNEKKIEISQITNPYNESGKLDKVINDADVFIGLSTKNVLTQEMVKKMSERPIIFAMANPEPEIMPDDAIKAGAFIVATGRSDFPNQINNCLGFPGIFRGLLDTRSNKVTNGIKIAAALAIASVVKEEELVRKRKIIPSVYEMSLHASVAEAVAQQAIKENVATNIVEKDVTYEKMMKILKINRKRFGG